MYVLKLLKSKTVWAGAATAALGVIQYAQPFIPAQYVPVVLAVSGLLTASLRTITKTPISEK